jgi:hypothetical protein
MCLGATLSVSSPIARAAEFYAGKDVTVLVGFQAGGTVRDTQMFVSTWGRHVRGHPNFVVKTMPGGGGTTALNFLFERARPDGLTLFMGSLSPASWALGEQQLRARYEDMEVIGGITEVRVTFARTDIVPGGMKRPADIMAAKDLKTSGVVPSSILDLLVRMPLDILGIGYRHVSGFPGAGTGIHAAMKRGEVHVQNVSIRTYRTRSMEAVRSGEMMGLFYLAYVDENGDIQKNPHIDELVTFPEFYQQIHGRMPAGRRWEALNWLVGLVSRLGLVVFAPPGTPAEALAELRASYLRACDDPELQRTSLQRFGIPYGCVDYETGRAIISSLVNVDPAIVEELRLAVPAGVSFY